MRSLITIFAVTALLSACGGTTRYAYVKEGSSSRTTQSAMSKCDYQIRVNKTAPSEQAALRKLCMEGEGYRLQPVR